MFKSLAAIIFFHLLPLCLLRLFAPDCLRGLCEKKKMPTRAANKKQTFSLGLRNLGNAVGDFKEAKFQGTVHEQLPRG